MHVILDAKRRLLIPAGISSAKPGDVFEIDFDAEEDVIAFRRMSHEEDWFEVLSQCPIPMDDLPKRRRAYFRSRL